MNSLENWRRESCFTRHTTLWLQWLLCVTVALNLLITLHILLIWHHLTIFCSPTRKNNHCPGEKRTPLVSFPGIIRSRNVYSTTFQSPELLIQCGFIWKGTTQLVSWKVEFNACQVSLLWHNFLISLWTFHPTLVMQSSSRSSRIFQGTQLRTMGFL